MAELTLAQIGDCAREAQIAFCLDKYPSYDVALVRKVEAALSTNAGEAAPMPTDEQIINVWNAWPRQSISSRAKAVEFFRAVVAAHPPAAVHGQSASTEGAPSVPDDLKLTLLMAPYHLNLVVGRDREQLLNFGRDVWAAAKRGDSPTVRTLSLAEVRAASVAGNEGKEVQHGTGLRRETETTAAPVNPEGRDSVTNALATPPAAIPAAPMTDGAARAQEVDEATAMKGGRWVSAHDIEHMTGELLSLVTGDPYTPTKMVDAFQTLRAAIAQPAPVQQEAAGDALADLHDAVAFLDQMRAAAKAGDDVDATGVAKDAREWLERAARAALQPTQGEKGGA